MASSSKNLEERYHRNCRHNNAKDNTHERIHIRSNLLSRPQSACAAELWLAGTPVNLYRLSLSPRPALREHLANPSFLPWYQAGADCAQRRRPAVTRAFRRLVALFSKWDLLIYAKYLLVPASHQRGRANVRLPSFLLLAPLDAYPSQLICVQGKLNPSWPSI
jgi:hypothetical protein